MKVSGFAFYCEWIKTNGIKKRRELKDDWVMDMKKLWNMLDKTSWKAVLYFIIASIAISISGTSTSMIAKYSVNGLLYHDDSAFIIIRNLLILLMVGILIVILFRRFGYAELMKIRVSLENKVFKSVLYRRVDEQEQVNNGQIISNITQDVKVIISFLESDLPEVIESLVTALIMSIIVLYYNWIIFLLVLGLSAISSCSIFFSKKMYQFDQDILKQNDRGNTLLMQLYHSSAILHMYLGTKKMMEEYKKIAVSISESEIKKVRLSTMFYLLASTSNLLRELTVIILGPLLGGFDIGTVLAMLNITSFMADIIPAISDAVLKFSKMSVSCDRLYPVINSEEEKLEELSDSCTEVEEIVLRNVSYHYDGTNGFENMSLCFKKGKIHIISGMIGAGKTTLLKNICGLLIPERGEIRVNNQTMDAIRLRQIVSYVDQKSTILNGSIMENISCFEERPEKQKVYLLLEKLGLSKWVEGLEKGIDTVLDSEDENLSGGQRQRIAIARALYQEKPIIALDEPTASLDSETKEQVIDLLEQVKDNHIVIIITHDTFLLNRAEFEYKM